MDQALKVADLYKHKTAQGKTYLKGKFVTNVRLADLPDQSGFTVLPNSMKSKDSDPEYILFVYPPEQNQTSMADLLAGDEL